MIRLLEAPLSMLEHRESVTAARITSLRMAWKGIPSRGCAPDFYEAGGDARLSVLEGVCILDGDGFDPQELRAFLRMRGCRTLVCDGETARSCYPECAADIFPVLRYANTAPPTSAIPLDTAPPLPQVYLLLADAFGNMDGVRFDQWYSDIALRMRRGIARVWGVSEGDYLVSTAGVYHKNARVAVIGSVATAASARGRGYAGALVTALAERARREGRVALIVAKNPHAEALYTRLGFARAAQLAQVPLPRDEAVRVD